MNKRLHQPPAVERLAYSVPEVSTATGLGTTRIREELRSGNLRSILVGRRRLIPTDALTAFLKGSRPDAAA